MGDSANRSIRSFKVCTLCGKEWWSREDFLADREIKSIGYMAHFRELKLGLFCFNHETCGTTMSIAASRFTDLYAGPVFEERLTGTPDCPGYCLRQDDLRPCPAKCECAYIREVLNRVVGWEKSG